MSTLNHGILLGDLNARNTDFGDQRTNAYGRNLLNQLQELPLYRNPQYSPAFLNYNGASIIDHIITTEDMMQHVGEQVWIGTNTDSDHLPVVTDAFFLDRLNAQPRFRVIRDWKNTDWAIFKETITNLLPDEPGLLLNSHEIDAAVEALTTTTNIAIEAAVSNKIIRTDRPSLPPDIVQLIKTKKQLYRDFVRTRDPNTKTQWNRVNAIIRRKISIYRQHKWIETCSSLDYKQGTLFWKKLSPDN